MKNNTMKLILLVLTFISTVYSIAIVSTTVAVDFEASQEINVYHNFSIQGDHFMLDGEVLQIWSGSLHYFRVPSQYWRDRLLKLKAAGLNAVCTYVEWSFHEPEEREYYFSGDRDVAAFIRTAAEVGLHVLLRPGPYICAERDLGGLPYWLLGKYENIHLRSTDKDFMAEVNIWMKKLFEQISPLLFGNSGPILLVQVENEYGSYDSDVQYMIQTRDIIQGHVGDNAVLYTTDGTTLFYRGHAPDTLTTIDFGVHTNIPKVFKPLREFMPQGPLMNSEFYPGWLTHWHESMQRVNTADVIKTLNDMIQHRINFNMYMFHGGTNFEFTAGANYDTASYKPDITSYDYDAPLTEAGDPTPKYDAIRAALERHLPNLRNIPKPTRSRKGNYGFVDVVPKLSLLSEQGRSKLGKIYPDVTGTLLPTFEKLRQRAGLMLYETKLNKRFNSTLKMLKIDEPRDRVYVYVNGQYKGTISRITNIRSLPIYIRSSQPENLTLSLLVENQGRINYGSRRYLHDFKGILSTVTLDGAPINQTWTVIGYPLKDISVGDASNPTYNEDEPVLFEGNFQLPDNCCAGGKPLDTFIDTRRWSKGYIWINGYNLGRYWPYAGPQMTLYVPGVWLRPPPAVNTVQILELDKSPENESINFIDHPIFNS